LDIPRIFAKTNHFSADSKPNEARVMLQDSIGGVLCARHLRIPEQPLKNER
jgi:hypothetical protein